MIQNETTVNPLTVLSIKCMWVGHVSVSFHLESLTSSCHLSFSPVSSSCSSCVVVLFFFFCVLSGLSEDDGLKLFFLLFLDVAAWHLSCCLLALSPPCSPLCRHPMQLEVRLRRTGGIEGREGGRERERERNAAASRPTLLLMRQERAGIVFVCTR